MFRVLQMDYLGFSYTTRVRKNPINKKKENETEARNRVVYPVWATQVRCNTLLFPMMYLLEDYGILPDYAWGLSLPGLNLKSCAVFQLIPNRALERRLSL